MKTAWLLLLSLLASAASAADPGWSVERGHERWIHSVAFSADGKYVASGSDDQTAKIWDAASGKQLWEHCSSTAITAVTWSTDSQQLLVGDWRGGVQVLDARTGKLQREWQAHRENISGLAVSHDGLKLATSSGDDSCKIWDLATRRSWSGPVEAA